jgi:hypothetical protein
MTHLSPGDRMPFCAGVGSDRQFYSFDLQAGRAAVLVLDASAASSPAVAACIAALAAQRAALAALGADLLVLRGLSAGPPAWQSGPGVAEGLPVLLCPDAYFPPCGIAPDSPMLVVIDRVAVA